MKDRTNFEERMNMNVNADQIPRRSGAGLRRTAVACLGIVGVVAASLSLNGQQAVTAPTAEAAPLTLSMKVKPGEPVPMELVTKQSSKELSEQGFRGQGIDVALIDSGVAPVVGLDQPGKVIYGPDLSNEGGQPNLANLDTYGHGTHLAGIIAGDDGDQVVGVATDSRIVSVKVAGATGETSVAQVIAAIDWVVEHKNDNGLNIRVLNLSLGVAGVRSSAGDPLSAAVERAWHAGIVVVAAAGNRGNDADGVDSPAVSPYVIAVGGSESYDSTGKRDKVATWSSGGNDVRYADVVAPGRSIMSFRVPGSMLDQLHPGAVREGKYFLGSGTSQSAAIVSGFTAALLSLDPSLTPDEVKYLFEQEAKKISNNKFLDGSGAVDAKQTAKNIDEIGDARSERSNDGGQDDEKDDEKDDGKNDGKGDGKGDGNERSNDAGNGHANGNGIVQTFPPAIEGMSADGLAAPAGASWSGGAWNGASWSGGVWSGASWSGASWSGASWSGGVWSGASWSGASWSGASWSGASWSGASWSGASWSGASWSGASWLGESWS